MSLSETRFGANATGLPGPFPLPSLTSALSRRAALFGAFTVVGVSAAALPAKAGTGALSADDARLVELANAYEALAREVNATHSETPGYDALVGRFSDIEWEMQTTPSGSLAGVVAKARALQVPAMRECAEGVSLSAADDVFRLFGESTMLERRSLLAGIAVLPPAAGGGVA